MIVPISATLLLMEPVSGVNLDRARMIAVEAGEAVTVEHGVPKGELCFGPPATWPTRLVKGLGISPDMSAVGAKRPLAFMYSDKALHS